MWNNAPFSYDFTNTYNAFTDPSTMHADSTGLAWFFKRQLLERAMSVFKFELPATWNFEYFMYVLFVRGFLTVFRTDKFGVIPQACGLYGYNVFYAPTDTNVSNPLIRTTKYLKIGRDCTLIKLKPDYMGIWDLVSYYGDMMALTAMSAAANTMASKLSYVFVAKNKSQAESFKKLSDQIFSGEISAVIDRELLDADGNVTWQMFTQNVKENYIAGDLMEDMRRWERMFDAAIGLPTANTEKRERVTSYEINSNNAETYSKVDMWLEQLKKSFEETREMFGLTDLSVDWRYPPKEGGVPSGSNVVNAGTV